MAQRSKQNRVPVTQVGNRCRCCAEKSGVSDTELFGDDDLSYVDAFLDGDREGWTLRQEYYEPVGFSRQRRTQLWDNAFLDKWIALKFKGQRVKEALTGDGIDTIRVGRESQEVV